MAPGPERESRHATGGTGARKEGSTSRRRRLINGDGRPFACSMRLAGVVVSRIGESAARQRKGETDRNDCRRRANVCWYKTNGKTTKKTSSLKLKEAKIGILLPKSSVPRGLFRASGPVDCLLLRAPPPSCCLVGTDKFVDVYTEITGTTSGRKGLEGVGGGGSIDCRESDDGASDST